MAVTMKIDCRLLGCDTVWLFKNQSFRGAYRFHHQGEKNQRAS
jgi:hypothetical protein